MDGIVNHLEIGLEGAFAEETRVSLTQLPFCAGEELWRPE